jgi:hypothetical protein
VSALLVALAVVAQGGPPGEAASQPASQPAIAGAPGTARDVAAEVTLIYEHSDRELRTQESWTLRGAAGKAVPASELHIPLGSGTKKLRLDEGVQGFRASEDATRILADRALGPEDRTVAATYAIPLSGSELVIRRKLPFSMVRARVITEATPGLQMSSNIEATRRDRDLNGITFAIWDFPAMPAGDELELRFSGLPTRVTWPRTLAMVVAGLIIAWAIWALRTGRAPGREEVLALGALSGKARRDRLIKAIEILERNLKEEVVTEKVYQRRHQALMQELAVVLRDIELEERQQRRVEQG